jgi:hypothetical protein
MLCAVCSGIELSSLLFGSKAESLKSEARGETELLEHPKGQIKHHDDIFKIRASANDGCELCEIIIKEFDSRRLKNENLARDMPIVMRSNGTNGFVASIDSPEGLIELCGFDLYIPPGKVPHIKIYCALNSVLWL